MLKTLTTLSAAFLLSQTGLGQPAIFEDNTLHIFRGAVVTNDGTVSYYRDIRLNLNDTGSFDIAGANEHNLAEISTVGALVNPEADSVEVVIEGLLSSSCVELDSPAVLRNSNRNEILIVLAEIQEDTGEVCPRVAVPFSTSVEVDLSGFFPGTYIISVNGFDDQTTFSLSPEQASDSVPAELNAAPVFTAPETEVTDPAPGSP